MVLKILLLLSVLLQLAATITAISLMRRTKYNLSWILFSAALVIMSALRLWEFFYTTENLLLVWLGVATSLSIAVGMFYVRRIFSWQEKRDQQARISQRRILNTVMRTEEKERVRFSKELHDGLGPLLSSARMSLSAIKEVDNPSLLENANLVIGEAIASLREISNNLSPHILNDFGLARGVSNFIGKLPEGRMEISLKTDLRGERFDDDVEVIVYRVICELINNSLKHADASQASVGLNLEGDRLTLEYSDNGRGFVPEAMMDVGMGLSNIASRVASLKGSCSIWSEPGRGMSAHISVNPGMVR